MKKLLVFILSGLVIYYAYDVFISSESQDVDNNLPVAKNISLSVDKNSLLVVELKAKDEDGDRLVYEIITYPKFGKLTGKEPNLQYKPYKDFYGEDSFEYSVFDGKESSEEAIVNIRVLNNNNVLYEKIKEVQRKNRAKNPPKSKKYQLPKAYKKPKKKIIDLGSQKSKKVRKLDQGPKFENRAEENYEGKKYGEDGDIDNPRYNGSESYRQRNYNEYGNPRNSPENAKKRIKKWRSFRPKGKKSLDEEEPEDYYKDDYPQENEESYWDDKEADVRDNEGYNFDNGNSQEIDDREYDNRDDEYNNNESYDEDRKRIEESIPEDPYKEDNYDY